MACGSVADSEPGALAGAPPSTSTTTVAVEPTDATTAEADGTTSVPASAAPTTAEASSTSVAASAAPTTADSTTTTAAPTTTVEATTTSTTTTSSTTTTVAAPDEFVGRIVEIDAGIAERMSASWRPGCPVELSDLRLLELAHWNYDERISTGELVVHADHAEDIVDVFAVLFEQRFPIERMELVDVYDGDDDRSMAANNTSAFNCREVAWKPGVWSNHAFGAAIDVNPLVNPYVAGPNIFPPEGEPFADRSVRAQGGLYPGDPAVEAFFAIGWGWGGNWTGAKDWQHFSASGN